MLIISLRARILTALIALVLLIPVVGIPAQNERLLEIFHNRSLAAWPQGVEFVASPPQFFKKAKAWLGDRAYPIAQASILQKKVLYFLLSTPPQRRITLGRDGFVFLNGSGDNDIYGIFESGCVRAHNEAAAEHLQDALTKLAGFAHERGIAVDVVVVPTLATLYAEKLPSSVPERYRKACLDVANERSPLRGITSPPGVNFVYPFRPMKDASRDEAFFPKANWHPVGMSLKVVRDAYLARLGAQTSVDDRLEPGVAPSEIMSSYGIVHITPVYFLRNAHVSSDPARNQAFKNAIGSLFPVPVVETTFYVNARPVESESVVMVSDSYGNFASEAFAGAFRDVAQVTANLLPDDGLAELVGRATRTQRVDRIILLFQEGNIDRIVAYANGLPPGAPAGAAPRSP